MRRPAAALVVVLCSLLVSGCGGLLDLAERAQPKTLEESSLEAFTRKGYRIDLPCEPVQSVQSMPVAGGPELTIDTWTCEDASSAYGITTTRIPRRLRFDLDGAAQGAAEAVGGTVVSDRKVTHAGSPAREVRIADTLNGRPVTMFVHAVVHRRTIYQVQAVIGGEDAKKTPLYRRIVRSLRFS